MRDVYSVIVSPIYTEKATTLGALSKFVFKVADKATKSDVKAAVEKIFNVKVNAVNISTSKAKVKFFKGRKGLRGGFKKAIVSLEKGQVIEMIKGA